MTNLERIEALKWNIDQCNDKIRDLNSQRGKCTSYNHGNGYIEEFDTTWEYDKYIIDSLIRELEREIQSDLNRIASLEGKVKDNAW